MEQQLKAAYDVALRDGMTLQRLSTVIAKGTGESEESPALALCHAQMARLLIKERRFDEAQEHATKAKRIAPYHVVTLCCLVELHLPQPDGENPHADDESALEFIRELEDRCGDDAAMLGVCGTGFEQIGLYDDVLRVLHRATEQGMDAEARDELEKRIAAALMARYSNCPDEENSAIMQFLIDLVQYPHNQLTSEELATARDEITERAEFVLQEYLDKESWTPACKLVWKMGRAVPLSATMVHRMTTLFERSGNLSQGVQFFTECMNKLQQPALPLIFASRARLNDKLGNAVDAQQDYRMADLKADELARVQAQIRVVQGAFSRQDGQQMPRTPQPQQTPDNGKSPRRSIMMTPGEVGEGLSEGEGAQAPPDGKEPEEQKEEMRCEEEVARLAHELQELRLKLHDTKTELKTTQVMYGQSKQEIARMQSSLSSSRRRYSEGARVHRGADPVVQQENQDLKLQLDSWRAKFATLDQRNQQLEQEIAVKTAALRDLKVGGWTKAQSASGTTTPKPKRRGRIQKRLSMGGTSLPLPDTQILRIKPMARRPKESKCAHIGRRAVEFALLLAALAVLVVAINSPL